MQTWQIEVIYRDSPTKNVVILVVPVTWWGVVPRDGLIFEISIEQKLLCLKMFADFNFQN